jgi:hypothetical protein
LVRGCSFGIWWRWGCDGERRLIAGRRQLAAARIGLVRPARRILERGLIARIVQRPGEILAVGVGRL